MEVDVESTNLWGFLLISRHLVMWPFKVDDRPATLSKLGPIMLDIRTSFSESEMHF
jgi:hypothetical protein